MRVNNNETKITASVNVVNTAGEAGAAVSIAAIAAVIAALLIFAGCGDNGLGVGDGPAGGFLLAFNWDADMVFVRGGTFRMGCTPEQGAECWGYERPVHNVTLSDYYMGRYEVTQRQWRMVMGGGGPAYNRGDDLPVEMVSWDDVQEFIARLNASTGRRYRLPTEAEWEFAARGGVWSEGFKYAGGDDPDSVAWYGDFWFGGKPGNSGGMTQPVGTKLPNELGLHDMSGNVWEFAGDRWDSFYTPGDKFDPQGPESGDYRVIRGGGVGSDPSEGRVSNRYYSDPATRFSDVGFRLAMSAD